MKKYNVCEVCKCGGNGTYCFHESLKEKKSIEFHSIMNKCDSAIERVKHILPFTGFSKRQILQVFGSWEKYSQAIENYVRKFLSVNKLNE